MLNTASRIALVVALGLPGVAFAQSAAEGGAAVEEIVVTAQRREERLQDVPLSVSAVTGQSLERAGVTDTRQLTQLMPGLVFSRANTSFQPYIRGVGTRNANVGDESNVSVYVDGVYQPIMSSLGFDLINVQRVEVLRGPQGTLFGRNSTGGLINIITPDPSAEFGGRIVLRAGNFGEKSVQAYVTGGITAGLTADLAVVVYDDNGFVKDLARGGHVGARDTLGARGKILFEPTDRFRAVLTATYSDFDDAASVNNQPLNGNTVSRATAPIPIIPTKAWTSALDNVLQSGAETKSLDLQTRYQFSGFNVETTSSLQSGTALSETDNDGTTKPIAGAVVSLASKYHSNELRVLSTGEGAFSWIGGLYEFGGVGRFTPLRAFANGVLASTTFTEQNVKSWAAFGEGTYQAGEHWRLTAGLRYTKEKRDYNARSLTAVIVPLQKADFDKLTYRASLQYRFGENANVYATYSRGFKSGVFNGFATSLAAAQATKPETLDSYEVGVKADPAPWLRASAAVFHYDYKDIQQSARSPTSSLIVLFNAARAKMNGGEAELTARASEHLNLRAYATYLDAKYDSFPTAQVFTPRTSASTLPFSAPCPIAGQSPCGNISVTPYDASGKQMIRAPKFTFGVNFDYALPTQVGVFGVSGNAFYTAKYYWDFENRIAQPSYVMLNGELSWSDSDSDKALRVSVWGRNLGNEVVYAQVLTAAQGDVVGFERPRSYGVSLSKRF